MTDSGSIEVKLVYERRTDDDGQRVLVDRLWPRGLRRADAEIDEWCRDIAPSTELRKWFGHQAGRLEDLTLSHAPLLAERLTM